VLVHREGEPPADVGAGADVGADVELDADVELELLPEAHSFPGGRDVLDLRPRAGAHPGSGTGSRAGAGSALGSWTARHPRLMRAAGATGLACVLVAVGLGVVQSLSGPELPVVTAAAPVLPTSDQPDAVPSWAPGADGRPSSPVTVNLLALLTLRSGEGTTVRLLGPAGPGILPTPTWEPVTVAPDGTARPRLITEVDCEQVPIPVPANAYRLRVEVRDRSRRTSTGTVAAGAVSARLGELVQSGCGPWLARKHLTVVSATAHKVPLQAQSDLDLSIANTGDLPGRLESPADFGAEFAAPAIQVLGDPAGSDLTRVRLAAHATTVLRLRLTTDRCDTVASLVANPIIRAGGETVTTSDLLSLTADTTPAPAPATSQADRARLMQLYLMSGDGLGRTGIVLAPQAVAPVIDAVSHLCAGLAPVVVLVEAVHRDPVRQRITIDLSFDLSPGLVSSVTLRSASYADDGNPFVPLWTTVAGLVPDRSGVVRVSLTYRPPAGASCPYTDAWMPPIDLLAQVPVPGGVRTVRFGDQGIQTPDPESLSLLCH
jgi:hypothetical protein